MEILPIKLIREEDGLIVGKNLVNLAKLVNHDLPVADGVVVTAPDIRLKTILEHFQLKDREIFEQRLDLIKAEIKKIPMPSEIEGVAKKAHLEPTKLWYQLLEFWVNEIRSRIWREGLTKGLTINLSAQPLFFTNTIKSSGLVFEENGEVVINTDLGKISIEKENHLCEIIKKANKLLFIPQKLFWVDDGKIHIVKVTSFTPDDLKMEELHPSFESEELKKQRSSHKIFLELGNDFRTGEDLDGIYIRSEKESDPEIKLMKLVEAASNQSEMPVIYQLADKKEVVSALLENHGGVRGALRLIHDQKLLKEEASIFLFARNKKQLLNTQISLPFVRSVNELLQLKRDLAALGVNRKASLKMWLEIAVPENIINLEEYLLTGVDGVIINLDELTSWLGGFDKTQPESNFYKAQVEALLKLLEGAFKILHKQKIPILVSGELSQQESVIRFLVEKGFLGVIVGHGELLSTQDHLKFVEKRLVSRQ